MRPFDKPTPPNPRYVSILSGKVAARVCTLMLASASALPAVTPVPAAIDWLKQQKPAEKPFFLYLSHKAVHANFTPEPKYEDSLKDQPFTRPATEASTPNNLLQPRWLRDQRNSWHSVDFPYHSELNIEGYYKRYCEALRSVDDSIGRVLQQLKDMGIHDDTLVIYMGDNGFMFGEHGLIDKRVAYETSMRVPMLVQCPALIKGGTVVNEMVANIDEFHDIQSDPDESRNLLDDPAYQKQASQMENKLYQMMGELGGMEIPLNQPAGDSNTIRLRGRGGEHATDFPPQMVVNKPVNTNAN